MMKHIKHLLTFAFLLTFTTSPLHARVTAFMKLWDNKQTYPLINEIEFQGDVPKLDTYNAIYGHGAMMENEYWGMRLYMDHRQSIDLFGKSGKELELHLTNFYSTREDLEMGRGCDILWAGQSVAAGSFRGFTDGKTCYVDSVSARGQRILRNDGDTAIVELWDRDWLYNGHFVQMRQQYTMVNGSREMTVDIWFQGESEDDLFATGAQKLEIDNQGEIIIEGMPEHNDPTAAVVMYSFGRNIPDKNAPDLIEGVGIRVRVPMKYVIETKETDIDYLAVLRPVEHHIQYTVSACSLREISGPKTYEEWKQTY